MHDIMAIFVGGLGKCGRYMVGQTRGGNHAWFLDASPII